MRLTRKNMGWSRVVVLTWAALWMLAAPLVHIHPEADHRHGSADHRHGGTIHTVFSPDMPGEFSEYHHVSIAEQEIQCPLHLIAQPLHRAEHLEIDFVLASSTAPQVGKGTALDVAAHSLYANRPAKTAATWRPQPDLPLTNLFLATSLTSRAPPSV